MSRSTYQCLLKELRHNNASTFKEILDTEGLPQDDNWYDYDLLMKALHLSRKRMVNYLLKKKCRVNKPSHLKTETNTPLHLAVTKFGWCNIVEKILNLKARVTDVNADGNTALHLAFISNRSVQVINMLIQQHRQQPIVNNCNKDGLGLIHIACTKADIVSIVEFLDIGEIDVLSQVSLDCDLPYAGYSILHFAVKAGRQDLVQYMSAKYDLDLYAQDRHGSTPFHLALEKRDTQMVDLLLYYDWRNENYVNDFGASHFMAACIATDTNVLEQYIAIAKLNPAISLRGMLKGRIKDIEDYPNAGYTPLHFAVANDRYATAQILCENQVDIYIADKNGSTPFHLALDQHKISMIDLLFKFDRIYNNCIDDRGLSHFMAACAGTDKNIPEKFIQNAEKDPVTYEKLLNERVKDIPDYPLAGYTALHFASKLARHATIAGLLIGCDFHLSLTSQKLSPLDLVRNLYDSNVNKLLQQHCDTCTSCKDFVPVDMTSEFVIEMENTEENKGSTNGECMAAVKALRGNSVFGFSRDRIILFARTLVIANFPRFLQKWVTGLINYIVGPKEDCSFCESFNCCGLKPCRPSITINARSNYQNDVVTYYNTVEYVRAV